jgi:hypothetical protein
MVDSADIHRRKAIFAKKSELMKLHAAEAETNEKLMQIEIDRMRFEADLEKQAGLIKRVQDELDALGQ